MLLFPSCNLWWVFSHSVKIFKDWTIVLVSKPPSWSSIGALDWCLLFCCLQVLEWLSASPQILSLIHLYSAYVILPSFMVLRAIDSQNYVISLNLKLVYLLPSKHLYWILIVMCTKSNMTTSHMSFPNTQSISDTWHPCFPRWCQAHSCSKTSVQLCPQLSLWLAPSSFKSQKPPSQWHLPTILF